MNSLSQVWKQGRAVGVGMGLVVARSKVWGGVTVEMVEMAAGGGMNPLAHT